MKIRYVAASLQLPVRYPRLPPILIGLIGTLVWNIMVNAHRSIFHYVFRGGHNLKFAGAFVVWRHIVALSPW